MNNIDEIALRVADEVFTGNCEDNSEILAFARALLAELSNDAEPAWLHYCINGNWDGFSRERPPEDAYDEGSLVPLFTHHANTAEIEQRVAEACAKLAERDYPVETTSVAAELIRSGKWREYL